MYTQIVFFFTSATQKSKCKSVGNISKTEEEEEGERFTRRTRGEARKRFANLKVAFKDDEKVEKDKRIGKIVKKLKEKEKQSQRQKKRSAKAKAELAIDDNKAGGVDTEESKV